MRNNLFIAFEGIDGSGKSTQVKLLTQKLEAEGHKVYSTFEPTAGPIGKMIRGIFSHQMKANHYTIAGLFLADRMNHILDEEDGLLKKLEEGYTVITDRYYFSSYAYHGAHVPMNWVIGCNAMCAQLLRPDVTVYVDISPEVSMERLRNGREQLELFETLENQKKVYEKYAEAFELLKNDESIFSLNGNRSTEEIANEVWIEIQKRLK
jgi:dTMP kinase